MGPGTHWWDSYKENRAVILEEAGEILGSYPVDPGRVVLGGFSKGGEVAMVLALGGWLGAKGFIILFFYGSTGSVLTGSGSGSCVS